MSYSHGPSHLLADGMWRECLGEDPEPLRQERKTQVTTWYVTDPRGSVICMCMHADISRTGSHLSGSAVSELDVLLVFHQRTALDLRRNNSSLIEFSTLTPSQALSLGHLGV